MKITIKKTIGSSEFVFEVEEDKEIDALFAAGTMASAPAKCELCGSANVQLEGNKAQGYTFVKVLCKEKNCSGRSQLGQYKDGGFYWKNWEKYQLQPPQPNQASHSANQAPYSAPNDEPNVQF